MEYEYKLPGIRVISDRPLTMEEVKAEVARVSRRFFCKDGGNPAHLTENWRAKTRHPIGFDDEGNPFE